MKWGAISGLAGWIWLLDRSYVEAGLISFVVSLALGAFAGLVTINFIKRNSVRIFRMGNRF